jgi:retron-type reverse transcriptase
MDRTSYRIFQIPKKKGMREIAEPLPELKREQRNIMKWLIARGIWGSKFAHGFTRGRSIRTNALWHTGKSIVLRVDLKDFFPSISKQRVVSVLIQEGIDRKTSAYIAEKCTLNEYLPQGSPASPFLSNLVVKKLDYRLSGFMKKQPRSGHYTRYADDLCFSSDYPKLNQDIPGIIYIIEGEGFSINTAKTRIMRKNHRQSVTGVVVNKKPNISKEKRKRFRAELHNFKMQALKGIGIDDRILAGLNGMIGYFIEVCPYHGNRFRQDLREIKRLLSLIE